MLHSTVTKNRKSYNLDIGLIYVFLMFYGVKENEKAIDFFISICNGRLTGWAPLSQDFFFAHYTISMYRHLTKIATDGENKKGLYLTPHNMIYSGPTRCNPLPSPTLFLPCLVWSSEQPIISAPSMVWM